MLVNDIREDVKRLLGARKRSGYEVGMKLFGNSGSVWMLGEHHNLSAGFESLVEYLGYDIEFLYEEKVPEEKHVLNEIRKDIDMLCWWKGTNIASVARERGLAPATVYQSLKADIVKKRYYLFCKELGYGIRLKYIPREEK